VDPARLVKLIQDSPDRYSFDSRQRLRVTAALEEPEARFAAVESLLNTLQEDKA
jgi:transcription-repair coupling factor (superfamily II helicase)